MPGSHSRGREQSPIPGTRGASQSVVVASCPVAGAVARGGSCVRAVCRDRACSVPAVIVAAGIPPSIVSAPAVSMASLLSPALPQPPAPPPSVPFPLHVGPLGVWDVAPGGQASSIPSTTGVLRHPFFLLHLRWWEATEGVDLDAALAVIVERIRARTRAPPRSLQLSSKVLVRLWHGRAFVEVRLWHGRAFVEVVTNVLEAALGAMEDCPAAHCRMDADRTERCQLAVRDLVHELERTLVGPDGELGSGVGEACVLEEVGDEGCSRHQL
ncbi:unnamed protein product [Closterium sp. NIES-65]|nr:unnamed protein product [Closterium sp. NIES-65]